MHGKTSVDYYAIFSFPIITAIPLEGKIEHPETTIFMADAMNNIVIFTDYNLLYMQSIKGTFNPAVYKMDNTIIAISLDEMLRIIVIGTTSTIQVFPFDNILIPLKSLYSLTNTWALNYKLYFDPIFFRVIIDFDI